MAHCFVKEDSRGACSHHDRHYAALGTTGFEPRVKSVHGHIGQFFDEGVANHLGSHTEAARNGLVLYLSALAEDDGSRKAAQRPGVAGELAERIVHHYFAGLAAQHRDYLDDSRIAASYGGIQLAKHRNSLRRRHLPPVPEGRIESGCRESSLQNRLAPLDPSQHCWAPPSYDAEGGTCSRRDAPCSLTLRYPCSRSCGAKQGRPFGGFGVGVAGLFAGEDSYAAAVVFMGAAGGDFTVAQYQVGGDAVLEEEVAPVASAPQAFRHKAAQLFLRHSENLQTPTSAHWSMPCF